MGDKMERVWEMMGRMGGRCMYFLCILGMP